MLNFISGQLELSFIFKTMNNLFLSTFNYIKLNSLKFNYFIENLKINSLFQ